MGIYVDYRRAVKEYENISQNVTLVEESEYAHLQSNESTEGKTVQYKIDYNLLKELNNDFAGWIILPDSKINYPIVQSKDNNEYLNLTFEGQKSNSGTIFIDMNCAKDFSSLNTIIYGHNMKNGSMFRALNDLADQEYFESHRIFFLDIGSGFEAYEVISCYETDETDLISWMIEFDSLDIYENWLQQISARCSFQCGAYDVKKNTITLSTCRGKSGGPGRFVVYLQKMDDI